MISPIKSNEELQRPVTLIMLVIDYKGVRHGQVELPMDFKDTKDEDLLKLNDEMLQEIKVSISKWLASKGFEKADQEEYSYE